MCSHTNATLEYCATCHAQEEAELAEWYASRIEQRNRVVASYDQFPGCRCMRVFNHDANETLASAENYLDPDGPIFIEDARLRDIIAAGAIAYAKMYHLAYQHM